MRSIWKVSTTFFLLLALSPFTASAQLPQSGDLIFGLSQFDPALTLELVRGPAAMGGGSQVLGTPWVDQNFIQSVEFDNLNGTLHNANGNLLGLNFGASDTGGSIYNFATTAAISAPQVIGDTTGMGGTVTQSRLASLSVNPGNSAIAAHGFDTGTVLVYDYTPGDTMGGGASLSGARETGLFTLPTGATQGTSWLDDNTVLSLDRNGVVRSTNATTMATSPETTVASPVGVGTSDFASLLYNSEISPFLFGLISSFDGGTSISTTSMYVLDPTDSYSLVNQIDMSGSADTGREMAFDASGNLYFSQFGGQVDVILGAAANAASIADDSSVDWYTSPLGAASSFNGIDIGLGGEVVVTCDFDDMNGCNGDDIDLLMAAIADGMNDPSFDLNQDTFVNNLDRDDWLQEAGDLNIGAAYLVADFTLDGFVDGEDFIVWNANKFTANTDWTLGNSNGDGFVDGQDFIDWNGNKFMSSNDVAAVPEPSAFALLLVGLLAFRRRK